jgi:S-adenosylmethionine decarboxylase
VRAEFFLALEECGLHVRNSAEHAFYPSGITISVILAESHASISTWPEDHKAEIDLFCCGDEQKVGLFDKAIRKRFSGFYKTLVVDRDRMIPVTP